MNLPSIGKQERVDADLRPGGKSDAACIERPAVGTEVPDLLQRDDPSGLRTWPGFELGGGPLMADGLNDEIGPHERLGGSVAWHSATCKQPIGRARAHASNFFHKAGAFD